MLTFNNEKMEYHFFDGYVCLQGFEEEIQRENV